MSNDFIVDRINTAHALLDNGDLDSCYWVLNNISLRITDDEVNAMIKAKENEIESEYNKRYNNITGDATVQAQKLQKLNVDRVKSLLKFYDKISKEHELL